MKHLRDKKVLVISVLSVLLLLVISFYRINKTEKIEIKEEQKTNSEQKEPLDVNGENTEENSTSYNQEESPAQNSQQQAPVEDKLSDVSIKATYNNDSNSIALTLVGGPGTYSIQREVDGAWKKIAPEVVHTKQTETELSEKIVPADGLEANFKVSRVVSGKNSLIKDIVINWNLVVSGSGVTSFPGAL